MSDKVREGLRDLRRRAYAMTRGVEDVEEEPNLVTGGWRTMRWGEERFIPLGVRRRSQKHCKSCRFFGRRRGGPYCKPQPDIFINPDTECCSCYEPRSGSGE